MRLLIVCVFCFVLGRGQKKIPALQTEQMSREYWDKLGDADLKKATSLFDNLNKNRAKNVVLVLGDGMDLATAVAGRIKIGQDLYKLGEEHMTSLDGMPHVGLAKTYSVDRQIPDSAATATAILSGVKTRDGMVGVEGKVNGCYSTKKYKVKSAMHLAIEQGKSVGIVTTTQVQHATMAASYAHAMSRYWYADSDLRRWQKRHGCKDISQQLFDLRDKIQVILGGGRAHMISRVIRTDGSNRRGTRDDRQDLIGMWKREMEKKKGKYVWNRDEFMKVDPRRTDYLMGLFSHYHMGFALDKKYPNNMHKDQPSLEEMTKKAIAILSKNPKGFFLLVEGGLIDTAHHRGTASYALEEFKELDKAVQVAQQMTSTNDTLIMVTADHGHTLTIGGTSRRGNPILGVSQKRAADGKRHSLLLYGNGPGYTQHRNEPPSYSRKTGITEAIKQYKQDAAVPLPVESHSGEDVVVYASGPHAHLVHGVHEQSYLGHVLRYAGCFGPQHSTHAHC